MDLKDKVCSVFFLADTWEKVESETPWEDRPNPRYQKQFSHYAKFLTFGVNYEELEYGVGSYSVAIVMDKSGSLNSIPVELVEFDIDPLL